MTNLRSAREIREAIFGNVREFDRGEMDYAIEQAQREALEAAATVADRWACHVLAREIRSLIPEKSDGDPA